MHKQYIHYTWSTHRPTTDKHYYTNIVIQALF